MDLGEIIDRAIEPFAPSLARRRHAQRSALKMQRQFDIAASGRRQEGWRRTSGSQDREIQQGLRGARNAARELVRNSKYASSALRHMVVATIGDGIEARAIHQDQEIARKAQLAWEEWAHGPVDGRNDFFAVQKLAFRGMVEGGDMLIVWQADAKGPDGRVRVLEGDLLDDTKSEDRADGSRIVQGVEFDANGDRVAYWILPRHPGDIGGAWTRSKRFEAANVDHLFEELRAGQARGISWFAPVGMDFRDIGDVEQARLLKEKITACLALVFNAPEGSGPTSPFAQEGATTATPTGEKPVETIRPGLVMRGRPGETATVISPPASGDTTQFLKQQVAAATATFAPYYRVTGDVSEANYTSQRAAQIGEYGLLDDRQQNLMIPIVCNPAFRRRMRRLYLETGDKRFLEVKAQWAVYVRRLIDPLKDVAGEKAEIRAGLKTMPQALSERGRNWRDHVDEQREWQEATDAAGVVFDTDARRIDGSGGLQPPAGYIAPTGGN